MKKLYAIQLFFAINFLIFSLIFIFYPANIYYIAHRGHGNFENTADNFLNSIKFDAIECDVRVTNDQQFIINHEEAIAFKDGTRLEIKNSSLNELTSKPIANGKKVCLLSEYLSICKQIDKLAVIELKTELTDMLINKLLSEIDTYYSRKKTNIISFIRENLLKLKSSCDIELYLLFSNNLKGNMEFCKDNKINISAQHCLLNRKIVKQIHSYGLKVSCWTVNNKLDYIRMKLIRVDFITSDEYYS